MAHAENMSFKAKKTVFGAPSAEFWGQTLDVEGSRQADHNMAPLERMVAPKDQSELRRVLGVLVQHKDAIDRGGIIAAPLYRLTGKVPWVWGAAEEAAFEQLRSAALNNNVLAPFDPKKQVRVRVDASDDGKGWMIYQLRDADTARTNRRTALSFATGARHGTRACGAGRRTTRRPTTSSRRRRTPATTRRRPNFRSSSTRTTPRSSTSKDLRQRAGNRLAQRELDGHAVRS